MSQQPVLWCASLCLCPPFLLTATAIRFAELLKALSLSCRPMPGFKKTPPHAPMWALNMAVWWPCLPGSLCCAPHMDLNSSHWPCSEHSLTSRVKLQTSAEEQELNNRACAAPSTMGLSGLQHLQGWTLPERKALGLLELQVLIHTKVNPRPPPTEK